MSQHIIKCKTILKINEIETINLTLGLNFLGEQQRDVNTCVEAGTGLGRLEGTDPTSLLPR